MTGCNNEFAKQEYDISIAKKNVMKKFKETDTYKEFPKLYLNFYVREYFNEKEIIQIFGELNGEDSIEEYSDWRIE